MDLLPFCLRVVIHAAARRASINSRGCAAASAAAAAVIPTGASSCWVMEKVMFG